MPEDQAPEHVRRALAVRAGCTVCRRYRAIVDAMDALDYQELNGEDRQAVMGVLNPPMLAHEQRLHPVVRAWRLREIEQRRQALLKGN